MYKLTLNTEWGQTIVKLFFKLNDALTFASQISSEYSISRNGEVVYSLGVR